MQTLRNEFAAFRKEMAEMLKTTHAPPPPAPQPAEVKQPADDVDAMKQLRTMLLNATLANMRSPSQVWRCWRN